MTSPIGRRVTAFLFALLLLGGCGGGSSGSSRGSDEGASSGDPDAGNESPSEDGSPPGTSAPGEDDSGSPDEPGTSGNPGAGGPGSLDGNLFVAGATEGDLGSPNAGFSDIFFRSYGADGGRLGALQFGSDAEDTLVAVVTLADGSRFFAGNTAGSVGAGNAGQKDVFFRIYDASGSRTANRQFGSPGEDTVLFVGTDAAGRIFLVGHTDAALDGTHQGDRDVYFRIYDAAGTRLRALQFGSSGRDTVTAAHVAPDGSLFLAGETDANIGGTPNGGTDIFLRAYGPDGTRLYNRQFGSAGDERLIAMHVDADATVVLGGHTSGDFGGRNSGGSDIFLRVYDASGNRTVNTQFGSPVADELSAMRISGTGAIVLAGTTLGDLGGRGSGGRDIFLRVFDRGGSRLSASQFGSAADDALVDVRLDAEGGIYLAGTTRGDLAGRVQGERDVFVRGFGAGGDRVANLQFGSAADESVSAFLLAADGAFLIAGTTEGDLAGRARGGTDVYVRGYDAGGTRTFNLQFGSAANDTPAVLSAGAGD